MKQSSEEKKQCTAIENEEHKRMQDDELEDVAGGVARQPGTILCSVCHRLVNMAAYQAHLEAHRNFR